MSQKFTCSFMFTLQNYALNLLSAPGCGLYSKNIRTLKPRCLPCTGLYSSLEKEFLLTKDNGLLRTSCYKLIDRRVVAGVSE